MSQTLPLYLATDAASVDACPVLPQVSNAALTASRVGGLLRCDYSPYTFRTALPLERFEFLAGTLDADAYPTERAANAASAAAARAFYVAYTSPPSTRALRAPAPPAAAGPSLANAWLLWSLLAVIALAALITYAARPPARAPPPPL